MKFFALITLFFVPCILLHGQDFDKIVYFSWDVNKPLSNTEWVGETSARGIKAGYRRLFNDTFMAGVDLSWATYDEYKPTTTFEYSNGALTTDYFNYIYSYRVTISGDYILPVNTKDRLLPFIGFGIGAALNSYATYYNIYRDRENTWGFLLSPRAGAVFPFSNKIGLLGAIHYDFSTNKAESLGYDNFSSIGVQIGITLLSY